MLTKIFAYCLFIKSNDAYNFIRSVNALQCESVSRETFGNSIDLIEQQLVDIDQIDDNVQSNEDILPEKQIDVVLSVDAFSTTVLMREDESKGKNKNMFIYLLIPLKHQYKPIIVHIRNSESGCAIATINEKIDQIYEHLSWSKFNIKYCSCDGDPFYSISRNSIGF